MHPLAITVGAEAVALLAMQVWDVATRLVVAGLCAAVIGLEREHHGRPAGLRTHVLVGLGAAGFAITAIRFGRQSEGPDAGQTLIDPSRVIAAIVGGIGFLGAGAIIHAGGSVRGLTTAAGLWVTAAIGTSMGLGYFVIGGMLTGLSAVTIGGLRLLEAGDRDTDDDRASGRR